jgi:hypothetical protein
MTEARSRGERKRRWNDHWFAVLIIVLALIAGGLAAYFGSPQPWEKGNPVTTTTLVHAQARP